MKNLPFEILSWSKSRHEYGVRINVINHPQLFVETSGIEFQVNDSTELEILILDFNERLEHVEKCLISGNKEHLKSFHNDIGNSTTERQVGTEFNAIEVIEDLSREINSLKFVIEELKEELSGAKDELEV